MTVARRELIDDKVVGVYHCRSRCVRGAFLCGQPETGGNFDHRRGWISERLEMLSAHLAVDVLTFAVMSNHQHLVLRNRPDLVAKWPDDEVARRWLLIFPRRRGPGGGGATPNDDEIADIVRDPSRVRRIRGRLSSISQFMQVHSQHIARRANREDGTKGHFWESRFKSRRLLDDQGVLVCMTYVDLNWVRTGLVTSLLETQDTGAHLRVMSAEARKKLACLRDKSNSSRPVLPEQERAKEEELATVRRAKWLVGFGRGGGHGGRGTAMPIAGVSEEEYLQVLDWTGRQMRPDKRGAIAPGVVGLLEGLSINAEEWAGSVAGYGSLFRRVVGRFENIKKE
ncbi:MAG: hypothetical protein GY720_20255, partial [bacterium]|nr:hypothetical protein [bacterium]